MNSTLWDVCRWGPNGVNRFKDNIVSLARNLKVSLPPSTMVIWGTALPIAQSIKSALLVKQINFLEKTLRFDVMEANLFARQVMANFGHDVLDNHYYMRMQIHRRAPDGVHFYNVGIRFLTNLLLTHIALNWDFPLPQRYNTLLLEKSKCLHLNNDKISKPEPEIKPEHKPEIKQNFRKTKKKKNKRPNSFRPKTLLNKPHNERVQNYIDPWIRDEDVETKWYYGDDFTRDVPTNQNCQMYAGRQQYRYQPY
uniref:Uncharacterized protein n=1 Tax=Clastoptera arizonana TaxID=38151 RepID=A0A1B6BYL4_9HEMI